MSNFFKHTTKDKLKKNIKKVVRTGLGGPATVIYEFLANPTAANVYTKKDLDYTKQRQYMKDVKPMVRSKLLKSKKKNKKGPR